MKAVRIIIYIYALLFVASGIFVFVPWSGLNAFMQWFAPINLPSDPLIQYTMRNFFLMMFWIGILLALAARDPAQYRGVLAVLAGTMLSVAVLCFVLGNMYGLPKFFYWDVISAAVLGGLLLAYRKQAAPG